MILLIHPDTGTVYAIRRGDPSPREMFAYLVLQGYRPVGPRCQALAAQIRQEARPS